MAKAAQSTTPESTPVVPPKRVTREGLKRFTGDVVGFHDLEKQGHLYGVPRAAKVSDSKLDPKKSSVFVIFELLEDCKVFEGSGEDTAEVQAKKGDMVGVWTKGGMRSLRNMCGLNVLVQHTGEKVLKGRPKGQDPMKTYDFDTDESPIKKGTLIPLIEDSRKTSREPTFLDLKKPGASSVTREPGEDSEEDPGF